MFFIIIIVGVFLIAFAKFNNKEKPAADGTPVLVNDVVLQENVLFFTKLNAKEKKLFEEKVKQFLQSVKITPVNTELKDTDKLLIAAGAVIPVFRFSEWEYIHLQEVLVYEDTFNMNFQSSGEERNIEGMVGTGVYEGKMLLSKSAVQLSFNNKSDKRNTVIHEFVHLIDKTDGDTDGVPEILLDKQYVLPWLDLMHKEMQLILKDRSDIDDYSLTNKSEFFAVAAEYFFERPELLESKHPQLFSMLKKMFVRDQD